MLSNHDIDHLDDILAGRHGDWFTARLLRLIKKADTENRSLLAISYPEEVKAVELWEVGYQSPEILTALGRKGK